MIASPYGGYLGDFFATCSPTSNECQSYSLAVCLKLIQRKTSVCSIYTNVPLYVIPHSHRTSEWQIMVCTFYCISVHALYCISVFCRGLYFSALDNAPLHIVRTYLQCFSRDTGNQLKRARVYLSALTVYSRQLWTNTFCNFDICVGVAGFE